jgi:uncharacterized membrane protein
MNNNELEAMQRDELRRKVIFWGLLLSGIVAMMIGIIGIVILTVVGLLVLAMAVGSVLLGRFLLRHARNRSPWPGNPTR